MVILGFQPLDLLLKPIASLLRNYSIPRRVRSNLSSLFKVGVQPYFDRLMQPYDLEHIREQAAKIGMYIVFASQLLPPLRSLSHAPGLQFTGLAISAKFLFKLGYHISIFDFQFDDASAQFGKACKLTTAAEAGVIIAPGAVARWTIRELGHEVGVLGLQQLHRPVGQFAHGFFSRSASWPVVAQCAVVLSTMRSSAACCIA